MFEKYLSAYLPRERLWREHIAFRLDEWKLPIFCLEVKTNRLKLFRDLYPFLEKEFVVICNWIKGSGYIDEAKLRFDKTWQQSTVCMAIISFSVSIKTKGARIWKSTHLRHIEFGNGNFQFSRKKWIHRHVSRRGRLLHWLDFDRYIFRFRMEGFLLQSSCKMPCSNWRILFPFAIVWRLCSRCSPKTRSSRTR